MPGKKGLAKLKKTFPFKKEDILMLLMLEDSNSKSSADKGVVNKMVDTYAKLVEFYDAKQDPIMFYFIDKMQSTIFQFNKLKQKITTDKLSLPLKSKPNKAKRSIVSSKLKPIISQHDPDKIEQLMEKRKIRRGHEMNMVKKFETVGRMASANLKKDFDNFNMKSEQNHGIVTKQLTNQNDKIKQRIFERRQMSVNRSLNKSLKKSFVKEATTKMNFSSNVLPGKNQENRPSIDNLLSNLSPGD